MGGEQKKDLTRIPKQASIAVRGEVLPEVRQELEAAFVGFLQSRAAEKTSVPVDRRVFLTVAESAAYTGLPAALLRRLMAEGKLKSVRTGSGWRIPRAELEALGEKLLERPAPPRELSEAEEYDLTMNKLRRQGLLPPQTP